MSMLSKISGLIPGVRKNREIRGQMLRAKRAYMNAISAATKAPSGWNGIRSQFDEDNLNKEYVYALAEVQGRAQDLDVNNPDLRGFHRARVAQIMGKGVHFKHVPKDKEVGVSTTRLSEIASQVDRLRHLHSKMGGFDSTGRRRSEGTQQERALLTMFVNGSCLIHRVYQTDRNMLLPFSIELIPGTRISTPYKRSGDPKISYGVEYSDEHRTRVVGYHVRRVSKTVGNSFVPDPEWDFLPIDDCAELSITEMAGLDRSLPLSVAVVRMLRNRGELLESTVQSARAQAKIYAAVECADGQDPFAAAADETDDPAEDASSLGFMNLGDNVQMLFTNKGEKVNWNSAKLPDPDFTGFMDVTDGRIARGLVSSMSRFTRKVNSSWSGGRQEDQQDDPIIDQYRTAFCSAWQRVNEWFLESVWLADAIDLPGYSPATRTFWTEFRAQFPGKVHINPTDTQNAREKGYMQRTLTPQQACEEDGKTLDDNLEMWAEAIKLVREKEKKHGLGEGTLDFLIGSKTISTSAGDDIGAPAPVDEPEPGQTPPPKKAKPQQRAFLNRLEESHAG